MSRISVVVLAGTLIACSSAVSQSSTSLTAPNPQSDSAAVVAVVARFHDALARGDTATAEALLAPDLTVLESGGAESRAEYFAHHLGADIEFARAVPSPRKLVSYTREGNTAWLASTSTARGTFRGREVDSLGAELMILSRSGGVWRIRAIHWSSRRRS